MDPNYHEAYWIAVAAAAPIISLAYVVLLERLIKLNAKSAIIPIRSWRNVGFVALFCVAYFGGLYLPAWSLQRALSCLLDQRDSVPTEGVTGFLLISLVGAFVLTLVLSLWGALMSIGGRSPTRG